MSTTKQCFTCLEVKDISQFYRNSGMPDGYLKHCKVCHNEKCREHRARNREHYSEYEKKRAKTTKRKMGQREYNKRRRIRYPEKYKARQKLGNAVRDGRIKKEPCVFCGDTEVQAHHEDYSKPLDVVWVCFKCHREKFTLPEKHNTL